MHKHSSLGVIMDTDATYSCNNRAPEIYKAEEDQDANTEEHLLRVMASG